MQRKACVFLALALVVLLIIFFCLSNQGKGDVDGDRAFVAMCVVVKDEPDIVSWVQYHHERLNVSRIYLYDHGSAPRLSSLLQQQIGRGVVKYFFRPYIYADLVRTLPFMKKVNPQMEMFSHCLQTFGKRHKFTAFLDADELIVLRNRSQTLQEFLSDKLEFGGVVLNWKIFGSSGHVVQPQIRRADKPHFYQHYNACFPSIHVKSIVNTRLVESASANPHWFVYKSGSYAISDKGVRSTCDQGPWCQSPPSFAHAWINHYSIKSARDFELKVRRGAGSTTHGKHHTRWSYFRDIDARATDTNASTLFNKCILFNITKISREDNAQFLECGATSNRIKVASRCACLEFFFVSSVSMFCFFELDMRIQGGLASTVWADGFTRPLLAVQFWRQA